MARENVEIVRRAFESFNRRDLAAAADAFDADAEWVPYLAALEEEIYRGRDEIERRGARYSQTFRTSASSWSAWSPIRGHRRS
jgi:ketosteroid isomerase-like protein